MTTPAATALAVAQALTRQLTTASEDLTLSQSLAKGAAGIALLHTERAHTGLGGWDTAHMWLTAAASGNLSAADDAGLYCGAPAVAFAMHTAVGHGRYTRALAALDTHVTALAHRRTAQANARIDRGDLPRLNEFDLIYGLTGIGAHLLRHNPGSDALEHILRYLVRLTRPIRDHGDILPGWWASHDPSFKSVPSFAGGHANHGLAHGISGPLALLATANQRGITVDGDTEAIETICAWLGTWRQDDSDGPWWPQWVTRAELAASRTTQPGPLRPSWCYGTPGLARAQQLAAIATHDTTRQHVAEHALARCLADPAQLARITDSSLCHGWAGLYQTTWRAADDASAPVLASRLAHLAAQLARHAHATATDGPGLLEGDTGLALALHTAARGAPPASGWDTCLLLS